ncbi:Ig-like domain-containing protein [Curtobacterium sp. MCBD17_019]|uniref:Ig-like domain-containing protein n=1 Tax=Curtobacterium sp. MCBD17_019 TaxID=2175669 RepID=UPI000DA7721C|nr:Ig-like domain-containing protein [Curtobacterium sp. MCBD17_019]PZE77206.1 fibronectin type III domain-containing protein [Curtobacterium sp. MCBD17_019]
MLRVVLRRHRSVLITTIVAFVVMVVVATTAIVSSGYHTQRVDLGDGTVWVPSGQYGAVGRANTGVLQLNTAVAAASDTLAVVQRGHRVWSVDETKGTLTRVDVADATLGDPVTLPSGSPQVFLAGGTGVIGNGDTGQLWATPADAIGAFDTATKADLTLGADAVFDADDSDVAVYSPRTGTASLVAVGTSLSVRRTFDVAMSRKHDLQTAVVGDHLAVLDRTSSVLAIDGRRVALGDRVSGRATLQRSSSSGTAVTVASAAGLLRVSPSGGVTAVRLGVSGTPARPYVDGSCTFGAWSGGQAVDTCDGRAVQRLDAVPSGAALTVQHNGDTVVANDPESGRTWAIDRSGQLIDNWGDLIQKQDDRQQRQASSDDATADTEQKPPVATDDVLGARPGRTTVLPVLLNDYDPNGDPIVIEDVGSIDRTTGTVARIDERQQLQITLSPRATGTVRFRYEISDGNGGTASATVSVTVKTPAQNGAPVQVRDTHAVVVRAGTVSTNVLSDWVDPDGDPVYLASASAPDGDTVTTTPDGVVDVTDHSGRTGERTVQLVVSDGRLQGRGTLTVDVDAQGKAPLSADSFAVQAYAGEPLTVHPLDHVRGGNGTVNLTSVPAVARTTLTPSYDAGTFVVSSAVPGDHLLAYTVTDGTKTATGVVRVTVEAAPDASTAPITTPKTVFVDTLSTKDTDVTATDIDPAGGVLLVTGLSGVDGGSGVQATVLDQHTVRVTLIAPLSGPVTFTYTETNGLASSTGTVTVIEVPEPDHVQPPVAQPDSATVRVGDVATIDVLANDTQPDGEPLTLEPDLVQNLPAGAGLLFVSGDTLRYLAPDTPGNYTAVYRVDGPDGQHADAVVSIAVRERDAATNAAPVPDTITARAVAGQTVRVTVPLSGIDPDGDSVQLVGVASNPDKGSVSDVTASTLDYAAGDYSAGTDQFTYTVVDALGARATGTIRVGIAPRADQASNPVAQADHVTIRPGGSVTVRVLENDSDPDGGDLRVTRAEPNGPGLEARVLRHQEVKVTPPPAARRGDFAVLYTVANDDGGASTAFLTVTVDRDAAPLRPEVSDSTLDLVDILHRKAVSVDVLANTFFAEGSTADLRVGLVRGYADGARVTRSGRIVVPVTARSRIIPFSVARRDHPDVVSYAFVHVPGLDDALPQIDRTAPAITVRSESTVQIPLSKYVVTANGAVAHVTDPSTVKATHANGADLVVDPTTLSFTSAKLYYGNASISFEVTDGSDANGGKGRVATLVLPIKVTPRTNQPPSFTGSTIELQPGDRRTVDLTRLTDYPYPKDLGELRYDVVSRPASGVTATISGQRMTLAVDDDATKGSTASVGVGVADRSAAGRSGTIAVEVVASTRPLVQPAADRAVVKRGQTADVDVLANDAATNPFPGRPLRVVAIRGLSGGVPAGVSITPSADRARLTVRVAASARPVDTHLQYEVADATNDRDRYVWGDVTVSVQDVPEQPSVPTRTGTYQGGSLSLTWNAPAANNAAISDYRVTSRTSGGRTATHDCGASTVCTLNDLDPQERYTFTVTAVNAAGSSKPSGASAVMSDDFIPAAPASVTVTPAKETPRRLVVQWAAVPRPGTGSTVSNYVVTLEGPSGTQAQTVGAATTSTSFDGLQPGGQYTATVSARNAALVLSTADWNERTSAAATAVGQPATPSLSATGSPDGQGRTTVRLSSAEADWAGGTATRLTIARFDPGAAIPSGCPPTGAGATFGATDTDTISGDGDYQYVAYADNGRFCSASAPTSVTSYAPPATPTGSVDVEQVDPTSPNWQIRISGVSSASSRVDHYAYTVNGGSEVPLTGDTWSTGTGYGDQAAIRLVACATASDDYCSTSDPVSVQPFTTRATIASAVQGQAPVVNAPDNDGRLAPSGYDVSYCIGGASGLCTDTDPVTGEAFTTTDPVPVGYDTIRVQATVNGQQDPTGASAPITTPAVPQSTDG